MLSFILLLLLSVVPSFTNTITFNPNAECVTSQTCSFTNNNTWIGGIVPGPDDFAVINSDLPVTVVIGIVENLFIIFFLENEYILHVS